MVAWHACRGVDNQRSLAGWTFNLASDHLLSGAQMLTTVRTVEFEVAHGNGRLRTQSLSVQHMLDDRRVRWPRFGVARKRQGSQCCLPVVLFLLQRHFYEWPQPFGVEVACFALRRLVVPGLG